jgi:hypothetical protein
VRTKLKLGRRDPREWMWHLIGRWMPLILATQAWFLKSRPGREETEVSTQQHRSPLSSSGSCANITTYANTTTNFCPAPRGPSNNRCSEQQQPSQTKAYLPDPTVVPVSHNGTPTTRYNLQAHLRFSTLTVPTNRPPFQPPAKHLSWQQQPKHIDTGIAIGETYFSLAI